MIKSLAEMKTGEQGIIHEIKGGHYAQKNFDDLGIRVNKHITKISGMFMRGPVTVQIDNTKIAIGFGMASKIFVSIPE